GNLVRTKDPRGIVQKYTYDDLSRLVETKIVSGPSSATVGLGNVISTSGYDLAGNKRFDIDINGDRKDYVYDGAYHLVKTLLPFVNTFSDVPSGAGQARIETAYDLVGHKLRETDA